MERRHFVKVLAHPGTSWQHTCQDWFNAFFGRLWPKIAKYVQKLMEDFQIFGTVQDISFIMFHHNRPQNSCQDQEGNVTQKMQAAVPKLLKGAEAVESKSQKQCHWKLLAVSCIFLGVVPFAFNLSAAHLIYFWALEPVMSQLNKLQHL